MEVFRYKAISQHLMFADVRDWADFLQVYNALTDDNPEAKEDLVRQWFPDGVEGTLGRRPDGWMP